MSSRLHKIYMFSVTAALLVFAPVQSGSAQASQSAPAQDTSQQQAVQQPAAAQVTVQSQAISQTGLLPLFAVDMEINPSWVDGDAVPSTSAQFSHNGVNDLLDQAWTTLKPAGFNAIRFPVRLDDPKAENRLANLCIWANANGVRLIPVLQGTDAMHKNGSELSAALSTFITTLITQLHGTASSALTSYAQISFFQLERPMNHLGLYPGIKTASAQKLLLAGSAALRQAEAQALQGTSIQGTPISVGASYDFELIRRGAIAGVPLDPGAEQKAQDSLKDFLNGFGTPNIDAINIEWFPRSISSGDVDHFVTLLQFIKQAFPEREVTLTTGFSSAFNPADQAMQFYAAAVSNLGSFRASDGVDSKFVGVVFQQAFKGVNADLPMPAGTPDPSQWKWRDRAQQLSAMWSNGASSADMVWWTGKVQDNMGLTALSPDAASATGLTPLPTLQVLQEIASTLNQATQQVQTAATVIPTTPSAAAPDSSAVPATGFVTAPTAGYVSGAQPSTQSAGSPFQQMMFTLLQQFAQQITPKLMAKFDGSNSQSHFLNAANTALAPSAGGTIPAVPASVSSPGPASTSSLANMVWIGPTDVNVSTNSTATGQPVLVTAQIHNQSSDQDISGLTVELVNPANPSASSPPVQGGVTVPRTGVTPVQLTWAPDATTSGDVHLLVQALDSGGQVVTTVAVPQITVQGSSGQANPSSVGAAPASTPDTTVSSVANTTPGANTAPPANTSSATNTASLTNPGSTTNTSPATDSNSTTNTALSMNPGSTTSTGPSANSNSTTSTGSTTGTTTASAPTPHLVVARFSFADRRPSAAGQIPPVQAQVSNRSKVPTQPGQAQLFLDGKPQQMQTIGPVLPSGTLLLQFPAIQAASGSHDLQLVVTTNEGANAAATLTANVTSALATTSGGSTSPSTSQPANPHLRTLGPRALRSSAGTTFRIGNTTQGNTPPTSGIAGQDTGATPVASSDGTTAQSSQSLAPSASSRTTATTSPATPSATPTSTDASQLTAPSSASATTATNSPATTPAASPATTDASQPSASSTTSAVTTPAANSQRRFARTMTASTAQARGATMTISPATSPINTPVNTGAQPQSPLAATTSVTATSATPQRAFVRTMTPTSTQSLAQSQNNASSTRAPASPATNSQGQSLASAASGNSALASLSQRGTVRTIAPSSGQPTPGAAGLRTTVPTQPPAVRTIMPGAGISRSTPATVAAAQTPLTTASSAPLVAARPPAGVRTISPAMTPGPPGRAPSASATPAASTSPVAGTSTRTIAALSPSSSGIPLNNNSAAPPMTRKPAGGIPASSPATLDLAVSNQDLRVVPSSLQAGQPATFTAVIRNNGSVPAQGATAVFALLANGQRLATSQPMVFNVAPHGVYQARWSTGIPTAASVQVMISVMANGDANPANNQAAAPFAVVASPAKAPSKPR